jgi:glycerophosphoryl diester phosphodiesterase
MHWRTLDGKAPRVIAHRGASGERPEHTLAAYELAIAQGADVIEPDLVVSRDGVLLARHDRGLSRSTDIARHAVFATRRDVDAVDWLIDDFTDAELATLRAVQPFPGRSPVDDGRWPIPRFDAVLDLLEHARIGERADLLVYPELKFPREFAARGLDVAARFVDALRARYAPHEAPVWLQCFDRDTLLRARDAFPLRCHWLVDRDDALALNDADLTQIAAQGLAGLGANKAAVIDARGRDTGFVARAHAHGLVVHAWTFRDDRIGAPFERIDDELAAAFATGVDAVFCDFPATGLRVRDALSLRR